MDNKEMESIINGDGAYKVVEFGDWLSTNNFNSHIVLNTEDLKFYRLEGYIRDSPMALYDWSNAKLVEVVPVEKTVTHWREVG